MVRRTDYHDNSNKKKTLTENYTGTENKKQVTTFKKNDDTKPLIISEFHQTTGNKVRKTENQDNEDKIENVIEYYPQV